MLLLVLLLLYLPLLGVHFYFARKFWRVRALRVGYLLRSIALSIWMGSVVVLLGLDSQKPWLTYLLAGGLALYASSYFFFRKPTPDDYRRLHEIQSEIDRDLLGGK